MAAVGSLRAQQGRPGPQALRQPACGRPADGDPGDKDMFFDPAQDKVYRHPTFYQLPPSVDHM
jgi:hypothetical protein